MITKMRKAKKQLIKNLIKIRLNKNSPRKMPGKKYLKKKSQQQCACIYIFIYKQ